MPGLKQQREVLYVALLLHDIAKGRPEDHSIAGARIARRICPHMGLSADRHRDGRLAGREPSADVDDGADARPERPQDDRRFRRASCRSVERLKLLLILTVCDIRGVGPGVWNGWKGQLLRTLYYETEPVLTGGFSEVYRAQRAGHRANGSPRH